MQTREISTSELKGGGFLALPDGDAPHPAVVVIHEASGLNDNIRDITKRLAGAVSRLPEKHHDVAAQRSSPAGD